MEDKLVDAIHDYSRGLKELRAWLVDYPDDPEQEAINKEILQAPLEKLIGVVKQKHQANQAKIRELKQLNGALRQSNTALQESKNDLLLDRDKLIRENQQLSSLAKMAESFRQQLESEREAKLQRTADEIVAALGLMGVTVEKADDLPQGTFALSYADRGRDYGRAVFKRVQIGYGEKKEDPKS